MKKKLVILIILLLMLASISFGIFYILKSAGITNIDTLRSFIINFGTWSIVVFILIRVIATIFLSFVPACSMIFDLLAVALFGANWKAFVISLVSIYICSTIMYLLGRTGANKLIEMIIGKKELEKASKLLKEKGQIFYPIMMSCAGFPDDGLVCMAGVIKMNFIYFLLSTVIGRGIGCAFTIFGISLIPFDTFTTFYDWFVFIGCICAYAIIIIKLGNIVSDKINKK